MNIFPQRTRARLEPSRAKHPKLTVARGWSVFALLLTLLALVTLVAHYATSGS